MIEIYDNLDIARIDRTAAGRRFVPFRDDGATLSTRRRRKFRRLFGDHNYTAAGDFFSVAGTPLTWKSSTGTYVITCTSLAAAALRQGGKTTTTLSQIPPNGVNAGLPAYLQFLLQVQFVSAPAAGGEVGLYLGFSDSTTAATDNPGGLTGVDGTGPNVDVLPLLVFVGSLIASNNLGTGVHLTYLSPVPCLDIALSPVIYNNASVALDATALHTVLTMVPYYSQSAL